jgi:hypothetical protein
MEDTRPHDVIESDVEIVDPIGRGEPTQKKARATRSRRVIKLPLWIRTLRKEIALPVTVAILSGVATPLILGLLRQSDAPQGGTEWTGSADFHDSLDIERGAGSSQNTLLRERCREMKFAAPFAEPPQVIVALRMIDAGYDGLDVSKLPTGSSDWSPQKAFGAELQRVGETPLQGSPSIRVGVRALDVQTTGFRLCAFTWSNTRLHSADLMWLAMPGVKSE